MVGTIICEVGTINVRFYLLEVRYSYGYCRITQYIYIYHDKHVYTWVCRYYSCNLNRTRRYINHLDLIINWSFYTYHL